MLYKKEDYDTIPYEVMFPHFGMCLRHQNVQYAYIPVPRCGSSFLHKFFINQHNWKPYNYKFISNQKFFAVVRDPYERWLSGLWSIANPWHDDIVNKPYNLLDDRSLAKLFDDPGCNNHHTMKQNLFYKNLNLNNITFFNFDDPKFIRNISHFIKNKLLLATNFTEKWHKSDEKTEIRRIVEKNKTNYNKLMTWLEDDYHFMSKLKFYEAN